jgi:AcrR family transcriptional regulator
MGMADVTGFADLEMQPLEALAPRERILKTASDLFYRFSVHSVGIDRIIADSGVAKMTFYKHFPSKANLVATYLRHKSAIWFQMLETATEQPGLSPMERILAIFDALDGPFQSPAFRGCPFVKGLAEFGPDADAPEVQATITAYFAGLHDLVAALVAPLALDKPERTVVQILSLIQGSIVMAQSTRAPFLAAANRDAARLLLEGAVASAGARPR